MTHIRTVFVNGSACSSQTRSSSSSVETAWPAADSSASRTPNSFGVRSRIAPARRAPRRPGTSPRAPGIELEVAVAQDRRPRAAGAAREGADARDELGPVERLGEVVVGAEGEPVDEVVRGVGGGEHEDLRLALVGGEEAADLVAVQLGEVAVEHDHVVVDDPRLDERAGAVVRDVDRHPLAPEAPRDRARQALLVLGYKDSHLCGA